MEITFKEEPKNKHAPFLERFKHKINRVDRISGLIGALGLQLPNTNKQKIMPRKIKSQNHTQHPLSDPQLTKQTPSTSRVSTQINVNRFKTQSDEQCANKENRDINLSRERVNHFSRFGKWKLCLDITEEDDNQRQKQLNTLILPKISKPSQYASQGGSRIKEKLQNKRKLIVEKSATEKRDKEVKRNTIIR